MTTAEADAATVYHRQLFRAGYSPLMDEAAKCKLWAEHAPHIAQNSDLPEDPPGG